VPIDEHSHALAAMRHLIATLAKAQTGPPSMRAGGYGNAD